MHQTLIRRTELLKKRNKVLGDCRRAESVLCGVNVWFALHPRQLSANTVLSPLQFTCLRWRGKVAAISAVRVVSTAAEPARRADQSVRTQPLHFYCALTRLQFTFESSRALRIPFVAVATWNIAILPSARPLPSVGTAVRPGGQISEASCNHSVRSHSSHCSQNTPRERRGSLS